MCIFVFRDKSEQWIAKYKVLLTKVVPLVWLIS